MESKTSLTIKWQPPPYTSLNGIILGYRVGLRSSSTRRCALFLNKSYFPKKINCIANETKFNIFLNTNASTRGIILGNLVEDMKYCVKVAAYTKVGSGPFSQPTICIDMNRKNSITAKDRTYIDKFRDIMIEPWFIVIGAVSCLVTVFILFFCTWCIYKRSTNKTKYNSSVVLDVQKSDNGNR